MQPKEIVEKVEKSAPFLLFKETHKNSFLASLFSMFDQNEPERWLVGYVDPSGNKYFTFVLDKGQCDYKDENEAHENIALLDLEKVHVKLFDAIILARETLAKKTGEKTTKTIAVLQTLDQKETWNISFMTANFNVFNVKIDAAERNLLSENYGGMFSQA